MTSLAEQVKSITRKDSILQGACSYPIPFKPRRLEIHSEIHSDDRTEDECTPSVAGFPNAVEQNTLHPRNYGLNNYEKTISIFKVSERLSSVLILNLEN